MGQHYIAPGVAIAWVEIKALLVFLDCLLEQITRQIHVAPVDVVPYFGIACFISLGASLPKSIKAYDKQAYG